MCVAKQGIFSYVFLCLLFAACTGLSPAARAQNAGTLGDLVNNTLQQQPAADMLENVVSAAVTDQVLSSVQDVLDNVDGAAEIEAAAAQISAILDIAEGDAAAWCRMR